MPIDENAARAERKPWTYPYTADEIMAMDCAAGLRSAPARAAPALTALLDAIEQAHRDHRTVLVPVAPAAAAACRTELSALTFEGRDLAGRPQGYGSDSNDPYLRGLPISVHEEVRSAALTAEPSEPPEEEEPWVGAVCRDATSAETALAEMLDRFDCVANGYCTTCGRHRLYDLKGVVQPCENPGCPSHRWRAALEQGPPVTGTLGDFQRAESASPQARLADAHADAESAARDRQDAEALATLERVQHEYVALLLAVRPWREFIARVDRHALEIERFRQWSDQQ